MGTKYIGIAETAELCGCQIDKVLSFADRGLIHVYFKRVAIAEFSRELADKSKNGRLSQRQKRQGNRSAIADTR